MAITLSPEVEEAIESRMKQRGVSDPNQLVLSALELLDENRGVTYEELDDETRAAIEEADRQEGIPWESVRDELMERYGRK